VQKLGIVTEYLTAIDKAAGGSSDGPNLVREVTEEAERKSEYGSCDSGGHKLSSSSSSSSSSDDDFDNDDDMDDFML